MSRAPNGSWKEWRDATSNALVRSELLQTIVCFSLASVMAARIPELESGIRAGMEDLLDDCTDGPFPCDELTFLEGNIDAAENLRLLGYALPSNRRKTLSRHWAGGSTTWVRRGKTFVLSTGEISLAELSKKSPVARRAGVLHRAIDIPIDTKIGLGIFDTLPDATRLGDLAQKTEAECLANYGHAGYRFIKHLAADVKHWRVRTETSADKFMTFAKVPLTENQLRFARRFALAYAAGLEARRCGIVNLSKKTIGRSIRRIYRRAVCDR